MGYPVFEDVLVEYPVKIDFSTILFFMLSLFGFAAMVFTIRNFIIQKKAYIDFDNEGFYCYKCKEDRKIPWEKIENIIPARRLVFGFIRAQHLIVEMDKPKNYVKDLNLYFSPHVFLINCTLLSDEVEDIYDKIVKSSPNFDDSNRSLQSD
tara:strand:- start:9 stop:461 length:453 start_codon:yes stop_codon:yes gene_type:complete